MTASIIEQTKIQARVLVPLVKALQKELGQERANAIVRKALGGMFRKLGEEFWRKRETQSVGENVSSAFHSFAKDGALDYQVLKKTDDTFELNITGCRYAEFYKALGEPELGFLLVCGSDFPMAEGFGNGVELKRTQTIMQGASHCDFRYARKPTR